MRYVILLILLCSVTLADDWPAGEILRRPGPGQPALLGDADKAANLVHWQALWRGPHSCESFTPTTWTIDRYVRVKTDYPCNDPDVSIEPERVDLLRPIPITTPDGKIWIYRAGQWWQWPEDDVPDKGSRWESHREEDILLGYRCPVLWDQN